MKLLVYLKLAICSLSVNMLKLTNLYRKYYNMDELKPIPPLQMASDLQANTMCKEMKVTHEGVPGKETLRDRLEAFNFVGINIGENIAKQENDDYKEVFKVWIKSKLHRKNILGDYTYSAVTTCRGQDDNRYWVQVFGKDLSNNNIRELRQTATEDKVGGELKNYLLDYFSVLKGDKKGDEKSSLDQKQSIVEERPISIESTLSISRRFAKPKTVTKTEFMEERPISIESTLSISRRFAKPKTVTKTEVVESPKTNTENMEFLFKEGEDIKKILDKLPSNFHLSFQGNYKKYIAYKDSAEKTSSKQASSMLVTPNPKETPNTNSLQKFIDKVPLLSQSTTVASSTRNTSSILKDDSKSISQLNKTSPEIKKYEDLLKSLIDKLKKPETTIDKGTIDKNTTIDKVTSTDKGTFDKNTTIDKVTSTDKGTSLDKNATIDKGTSTKITSKNITTDTPKATSLTIDLSEIVPLSKPSSSVISSTEQPKPAITTTEVIYKTVYTYKEPASITKTITNSLSDIGNINILTITDKKKSATTSPTIYKTTKIGSISVLDSNSLLRTITVTVLKDSLSKPEDQKSIIKEQTVKEQTVKDPSKEPIKEQTVKDPSKESIKEQTVKELSKESIKEQTVKEPSKEPIKETVSPSSLLDTVKNLLENTQKESSLVEKKGDLLEFNSNMKKLFKDLINKKNKRKLFASSNIDKDTESKLKEYINSLVEDKDITLNIRTGKCDIIDIGEPIVD
ncbi:hypothetical protein NGRA_0226 [Nosema granulosis]|uniref:SCP domain-containing protein n=1 Tax=Nosema granulosis TaxID=83296 RepID=A0A9P6H1C1_9MICR|nr:hypothetical protein NGRA_0226 [Nosema granulosis]